MYSLIHTIKLFGYKNIITEWLIQVFILFIIHVIISIVIRFIIQITEVERNYLKHDSKMELLKW
jgi:uncharacterized membrane protein